MKSFIHSISHFPVHVITYLVSNFTYVSKRALGIFRQYIEQNQSKVRFREGWFLIQHRFVTE